VFDAYSDSRESIGRQGLEEDKFCRDCGHYRKLNLGPLAPPSAQREFCFSPDRPKGERYAVDGTLSVWNPIDARRTTGFCGPRGVYWIKAEIKPTQEEPKPLIPKKRRGVQIFLIGLLIMVAGVIALI